MSLQGRSAESVRRRRAQRACRGLLAHCVPVVRPGSRRDVVAILGRQRLQRSSGRASQVQDLRSTTRLLRTGQSAAAGAGVRRCQAGCGRPCGHARMNLRPRLVGRLPPGDSKPRTVRSAIIREAARLCATLRRTAGAGSREPFPARASSSRTRLTSPVVVASVSNGCTTISAGPSNASLPSLLSCAATTSAARSTPPLSSASSTSLSADSTACRAIAQQ